jgi:hypothetical protein
MQSGISLQASDKKTEGSNFEAKKKKKRKRIFFFHSCRSRPGAAAQAPNKVLVTVAWSTDSDCRENFRNLQIYKDRLGSNYIRAKASPWARRQRWPGANFSVPKLENPFKKPASDSLAHMFSRLLKKFPSRKMFFTEAIVDSTSLHNNSKMTPPPPPAWPSHLCIGK